MILLDASVLVAAYGQRPPKGGDSAAAFALREMIGAGTAMGIPAIVLQEVLAGVRDKTQYQELHAHLMAFRILPAMIEDHVKASQIAAECSAKQVSCTLRSALVVAQAAHGKWRLYTLDRELAAVARVGGVELVGTRESASGRRRGK